MSATDTTANDTLDAALDGIAYDVGLSSTLPNDAGTGWTEPTDPDYERAELDATAGNWNPAVDRMKTTDVDINWPIASVDQDDLEFWLLFLPGTDTLRWYGRLNNSFTIPAGSNGRLAAGELWIRIPDSTLTP